MLRYDVNSGPLSLIHDPTPRSLDQNLNNHASSVGNFRIKGFVNNNFVKASFPRTIPAEPILPRSDDPKVDLRTGRNFSEDYENTQTVPIRNAYAKTDDQIKKETRQFLDRQDEEKRYKEESVNKLREKHEEQRRTRQMMEESGPFGKPGAGAPNGNDYKKQKFREEQFYGHEQPKYQVEPSSESVTHRFQFWDSFGRPGHGAPLRTCSGNLKTQLVGDVIIRFQDRYVRDIENHRLHERPPEEKKKYFDDLRQQQQEKKSNGHLSSPSKPIGFNYMDYFGRCGPGSGAPMISESGHVKAQYQCKDPLIFFQNPDMAREQDQGLDGMPAFNSPGRNNLSSERERHHLAQQNLMKLRRENEMLEMSSPDPHTNPEAYMRQRPGFGPEYGHFEKDKRGISSPKSAPDTNSKFLENPYNDLSRNRYVLKPNREFQMPPYHPFGKAGGGAPRQDEQGNRVTQIMGLMDRSRKEDERMQEKIMKKKYRNELDQQVAQNMRKGTEQQRHQHEGQRDYAEIIDSSRRRPQSKHHLPRSDISLAKDGAVPLNRIEADKYRESLDEGFFAKQADRQLQRYKDNQESRQHVQQMTSYWGRYGGGYKKNEYTTHKGNLERLLNNEDGKGKDYEMRLPWAQH